MATSAVQDGWLVGHSINGTSAVWLEVIPLMATSTGWLVEHSINGYIAATSTGWLVEHSINGYKYRIVRRIFHEWLRNG
jgi:hypothetical protein